MPEAMRSLSEPSPRTMGWAPIFNNVACSGCHPGDGRGRPENALVRFGEPPDLAAAAGGPQLQDRAIPGAVPERLSGGIPFSVRLPPPVFGVGLIEAIPESALLALVDSLDANRDGISGRPNWVRPPPWIPFTEPGGAPGLRVGRFSRKAQVSTLLQQVVEAYHQDMGITSEFLPVENVNPGAGVPTTLGSSSPSRLTSRKPALMPPPLGAQVISPRLIQACQINRLDEANTTFIDRAEVPE